LLIVAHPNDLFIYRHAYVLKSIENCRRNRRLFDIADRLLKMWYIIHEVHTLHIRYGEVDRCPMVMGESVGR